MFYSILLNLLLLLLSNWLLSDELSLLIRRSNLNLRINNSLWLICNRLKFKKLVWLLTSWLQIEVSRSSITLRLLLLLVYIKT